MTAVPLITFLSDYGPWDEFVGVCHAVIARRCPSARVIDLGHGVPRHDVRAGALALRAALRYTPAGVHLAVVDPGVGGERRAVAARVALGQRILVGPDNGLLAVAAEELGGVVEAVDISDSPECLRPISATFHGRDVFAPVAAALADGADAGRGGRRGRAGDADGPGAPALAPRRRDPDRARPHHRRLWKRRARRLARGRRRARRARGRRARGHGPRVPRPPRRSRARSATCPTARCSPTATPADRSRSPSTAARPPRCSTSRRDDELALRAR